MSHHLKRLRTLRKATRDPNFRFSQALRFLLALGFIITTSSLCASQDRASSTSERRVQEEQRTLEPDGPIEGELRASSSHFYRVVLTSGQFLHVMIQQRGIDLVAILRDRNGATLSEMDGLQSLSGMEELSYEAASTGPYVVEVRAKKQSNNHGRYELKIQRAEITNQLDRARIVAERLHMEAVRTAEQPRGTGLELAVTKYDEAIAQWRAAGARKWEGNSLNNLGNLNRTLNRYEKALEHYGQALVIMREIKEKDREAAVLHNLGFTYSNMALYETAQPFLEQALTIWREIGDKNSEAMALNSLGVIHWRLNKHEAARECYERALAIRRETGNRDGEGQAFNNLALIYSDLGPYDLARQYYDQAVAIWRETKNRQGEGQALSGLGIIHENLSLNEKAQEYYEQSLQITREIKDRGGEGRALNNLGELFRGLKQFEKAQEFYEQTLAIMREIKDRYSEGAVLNNLCTLHKSLGENDKAREYCNQSLAIARAIRNRQGEGKLLNNLGEIYRNLNQLEQARQHYELSLAIMRETKDKLSEAVAHHNLGLINQLLHQKEKADTHLDQALKLRREIGDRDGEALTLQALAILARDRGRYSEALTRYEAALAIKEDLRATYTNQDLRFTYSSTIQDVYEGYIELQMFMHMLIPSGGHDAVALQASERSRAGSLLEILAQAGADIRQGVDPQLVSSERSLRQQLNLKAQHQLKLLGESHTGAQAAAIAKEVDELTAEYQKIRARIRRESPRYASLTQPAVLDLKEIQQLLDDDTLLLEYSLGKMRSYLWVVSKTSLNSYVIPHRTRIESAARRVYELFSTANTALEKDYVEATSALSHMLLGPAAAQLGTKRLLIVSDGYLQYLPFGALPIPEADNKASTNSLSQPLIVKNEVVTLPSASLLAVMRRELSGRARPPGMIAALADPVFDRDDRRIKQTVVNEVSKSDKAITENSSHTLTLRLSPELQRSVQDTGGLTFERLRSSRVEAEAIVALAHGQNLKALDFDASRTTALSDELGQYRVVHFATHGLLNSLHPELSGLVLSLVDEKGQPQDGFLRAHEIYNLKLSADLVVLSACQTALGKDVKGEGLVGLTRGFMYAGAPRVVASLWKVPSKATAELMKRFYREMLVEKHRPAAALRAAQIAMWREKQWNEPYYWAAFVLQGEWQ
jgi:CHAT domain-containing protein/Tfp pilus assembly protein PilF